MSELTLYTKLYFLHNYKRNALPGLSFNPQDVGIIIVAVSLKVNMPPAFMAEWNVLVSKVLQLDYSHAKPEGSFYRGVHCSHHRTGQGTSDPSSAEDEEKPVVHEG